MNNVEENFYLYLQKFGKYEKRSMFGGVGIFHQDAMYALITNNILFLRGGSELDSKLIELNCKRFKHVKRNTTAVVNYFDITDLFIESAECLDELVKESIQHSLKERSFKKSENSRRLRDLPNMQLTLERMVKKSGIPDVNTFLSLGAVDVFKKVQVTYGGEVDVKLLWKFAGAVSGCHWTLLQDPAKKALLESVKSD